MTRHQLFVKVFGCETVVMLLVKPGHFLLAVHRHTLARRLAHTAVQEPCLAILLITATPTPERPLADPKQLRQHTSFSSADSQRPNTFANFIMRNP